MGPAQRPALIAGDQKNLGARDGQRAGRQGRCFVLAGGTLLVVSSAAEAARCEIGLADHRASEPWPNLCCLAQRINRSGHLRRAVWLTPRPLPRHG